MKQEELKRTKELISRCNLIDDDFFKVVANDNAFCEELLHIVLDRPDIKVESCQTQMPFENLDSKSVVLDLICKDNSGTVFNVEIQKYNNDDIQKRMRYYTANIDVKNLKKAQHYKDLPDVYSIMISDFDIFKEGKTVYYINRVLQSSNTMQNNGIHELYLNANGKDEGIVTELMHYMLNSNGYNKNFPVISKRVQFYKEHESEVDAMKSVFDEIREEGMNEVLQKLGITKEEYNNGKKSVFDEIREEGMNEVLQKLGITKEEYNNGKKNVFDGIREEVKEEVLQVLGISKEEYEKRRAEQSAAN